MNRELEAALDQCLIWLRQGLDVEACLARYPQLSAELRPLLEAAWRVRRQTVPAPSLAARDAGRQQMLAAVARRREQTARLGALARLRYRLSGMAARLRPVRSAALPAWRLAAAALALLLLLGSGLTTLVSAASLPGDALYGVKLLGRRFQLAVVSDPAAHAELESRLAARTRRDVRRALGSGRQAGVEFEGVLQSVTDGVWLVDGLPVALQRDTAVSGRPEVGARVSVRGLLSGSGWVLGRELSVKLPPPSQPPSATAIATHTASPAVRPSATVSPTRFVDSTSRPLASDTLTPRASDTPLPTSTPTPTASRRPLATVQPAPTRQPVPSSTPTPEVVPPPRPSRTPVTAPTLEPPEPTETRRPTNTPEPTDEDDD